MVLQNIEHLLEKYHNGNTTIKEEAQLKTYFNSNNVASHLQHYKPLFVYFYNEQQEQYSKNVPLKPKKTKHLYQWISVAATIVLLISVVYYNTNKRVVTTYADLTPEELQVVTTTLKAFNIVSGGINEGKKELNSLALVSQKLNYGIEETQKLSEFSKTKNKIFKNKKP